MESLRSYDRWRMNIARFRRWLFANHRKAGGIGPSLFFLLATKCRGWYRFTLKRLVSLAYLRCVPFWRFRAGRGPMSAATTWSVCFSENDCYSAHWWGQQHASGPLFIELFSRCSFHLPARPTSPLNLRCRQVLVSERFSLMFLGAKPGGASRSRIHIDLLIWINPVLQGDPLDVVLVTDTN